MEIANFFKGHFNYLKNLPECQGAIQGSIQLQLLFLVSFHSQISYLLHGNFYAYMWQKCLNLQHASKVAYLNNRISQIESFQQKNKAHKSTNSFPSSQSVKCSHCIICGSIEYKLPTCCKDAKFLHKDGRSWKTPKGESVCYSFNSFSICNRGTICTHTHVCSFCWSSTHEVQACAA